jgi:hypothetical protein
MRLAYDSTNNGGGTMDDLPLPPETSDRGLAVIAALAVSEIFANAEKQQAQGFFRAVGTRLAQQNPIPAMRDLRELQGAVNAVWARVGLGEADITLDLQGVLIHHHDAPAAIPYDPEFNWSAALSALLVGAYDGWMRAMGSPDALQTRVLTYSENIVEIRHGAEIDAK